MEPSATRSSAVRGPSRSWDYETIRDDASDVARQARAWFLRYPALVATLVVFGALSGLLLNRTIGARRYQASVGVSLSAGGGAELPALLSNLASAGSLQLPGQTAPLAFQSYILDTDPFLDTLLLQRSGANCSTREPCRLVDHLTSNGSLTDGRVVFRKRFSSTRDERGKIILISFADRDSNLARRTVDSAVAALGRVNRTLTASAAEAKVSFLAGQLPILSKTLDQIQDSLTYFYRTNRSYGSSPELRFREDQLKALYDAQARLVANIREQIARSEVQARGGLQVVQTILPVSVDPKPIRPFKNAAAAIGALVWTVIGFLLWRRKRASRPT